MKKLTLHRVHRVTTFAQVKQIDKHLNGTKHMKTKEFKAIYREYVINDARDFVVNNAINDFKVSVKMTEADKDGFIYWIAVLTY